MKLIMTPVKPIDYVWNELVRLRNRTESAASGTAVHDIHDAAVNALRNIQDQGLDCKALWNLYVHDIVADAQFGARFADGLQVLAKLITVIEDAARIEYFR